MIKISKALALQIGSTSSLKEAIDNTVLRLFAGNVPDTADDSIGSATMLVEIRASDGSPLQFEVDSLGRVIKSSNQQWNGTAINTGRATFYRLVKESDTNGVATTEVRIQGTVSDMGADLTITNPDITTGAIIPIGSGGYYFPTIA
ncbi:hypothetical protein [Entomomonas asaccharolytica]|uniref:Uncharacterized protein n=1 Tax=Entomomonas asaccharolytica TaxID=2785331 RepID=A0A974RWD0_9GAMM|nr:hypothetical protein [Entomomonas asaccharolytica]QQP85068.1 hypothetical protein JHT90_11825 [Entomomonas asaccharolytica]